MDKYKTEDWVSLAVGFLIVIVLVSGIELPPLKLKWSTINADAIFLLGVYFVIVVLVSAGIAWLLKPSITKHISQIVILGFFAFLSIYLSSYENFKKIGLEYVIFSLFFGILLRLIPSVSNYFEGLNYSEYFIKIGLVLLGASVIFGDILKAGSLGLIQALVVVVAVWYFAFWLGTKFKIDEELKIMLASAVSICGVSAAIATAGAIKGDSKKLSYVVSLVLIVSIPMLIFQPLIAKALQLTPQVAGAWLGGTIDTTGAVVASGELLGEEALKYSTVVKFSQNILLGIAALLISIYWTIKPKSEGNSEKVSLYVLWERFPKFVLGFIGVSLLFSFILAPSIVLASKEAIKSIQTLLFSIAFVGIGLEADFKAFFKNSTQKPAFVFLISQLFNIVFTLGISIILF
jgi:uncharacterized integral membrane protein (TIGR00698 family)